jgi:hypothetical protein
MTKHLAGSRTGRQRQVLIVAAALLAVGFGFCLLPGHHGEQGNHAHAPNLCASLVVVLIALAPLMKPVLSGRSVPIAGRAAPPLLVRPFDRPPEFAPAF